MVPPTGSNMTYDRAIDSRWGDGMRSKHNGDRGSQSQILLAKIFASFKYFLWYRARW